jgi:hypothetical protein
MIKLPEETEVFTRVINYQNSARVSHISLKLSPKLQRSLESRWLKIIADSPDIENDRYLARILVRDLFDRLNTNPSDLIIQEHWLAFLSDLALRVAEKIFKTIDGDFSKNISTEEIQSICLATIVNPSRFFVGFNCDFDRSNNLLSSLKSYAYNAIKYAAYPSIRKEFADPNIGRNNLSLFNQYSDGIIDDALTETGIDRTQIDRDLNLCQSARAYLHQTGTRINRLQSIDFDRIGELYRSITGNSPPPVRDRLEQIGAAIRKFTSPHNLSSHISPEGTDRTIEDTFIGSNPQPEKYLELKQQEADWQQVIDICDRWLRSNLDSTNRQIIYLRYHFKLNQKQIEPIVYIDQTNISRRLRRIYLGIARSLADTVNPSLNIQPVSLVKPIVELLQENFDRFTIGEINPAASEELAELIQIYRKSPLDRIDPILLARIQTIVKLLIINN